MQFRPVDLALSEDEQFAVLRTCRLSTELPGGAIYVVDVATGSVVLSVASGASEIAQDYVSILGKYAVAISGVEPIGSVEFLSLAGGQGAQQHLGTQWIPPGATDVESFYAPLGGKPTAVVVSQYGMHLYDMAAALTVIPNVQGPLLSAVNGALRSTALVSDSVLVAGNKVLGIVNGNVPYLGGSGANYGAVGIGDLTAVNPSNPNFYEFYTFGFSCDPASTTICQGLADELLHDVTASPNGHFGVVSGHGAIGVYRLRTSPPVELYSRVDHSIFPHPAFVLNPYNRVTCDSVEVSNSRAVVIGKDLTNTVDRTQATPSGTGPDTATWRVTLVDLLAADAGAVNPTSAFADPSPAIGPSRAHDVAITPNGARAIVSTRRNTLVFDLTLEVNDAQPNEYPTGCDPLMFPGPNSALVANSVVSSDSYAVVVGRTGGLGGTARACVIDLLQPPGPGAIAVFGIGPVTAPSGTPWWVPSDVAMDVDGAHAVVRLVDASYPPGTTPPGVVWGRIVVLDLATKSVDLDIDVNASGTGPTQLGASLGVNSVAAGYNRVLTLGELDSNWGRLQLLVLD